MKNQLANQELQILIVDDTHENHQLLTHVLNQRGYIIHSALAGKTALRLLHEGLSPDLILLDIMMPGMNGYEVCSELKKNEATEDIPIIFLTALHQIENKMHAFAAGAQDYITKPFQIEEVLARVHTHLSLKHTQRQLQAQVEELDAFAHTVAHDLKNPLSIVMGYSDHLLENLDEMDTDTLRKSLKGILRSTHQSVGIIEELLLLAGVRKATVETAPVKMEKVVTRSQYRLTHMIEKYEAKITQPESWPTAVGYAPWLEEVWINYLSNAIKYGGCPAHIEIGADPPENGMVRFWVRDFGEGLTEEQQTILFTEFTRLTKIKAEGHGLGLSIVRRIISKLNGSVGVESTPGSGALFYFSLPVV